MYYCTWLKAECYSALGGPQQFYYAKNKTLDDVKDICGYGHGDECGKRLSSLCS